MSLLLTLDAGSLRMRAHDGATAREIRDWPSGSGQEALLGDLPDWATAHGARQFLAAR